VVAPPAGAASQDEATYAVASPHRKISVEFRLVEAGRPV
jgi:hypothetical protein